jgi:hypothetical protein
MEVNESPYHTTSVRLDTSMDGVNWATQTTVVGNTDAQIDGSFLPVQAKYVRITSLASNDPLYPNIIRAVRLRGPNDALEVNPGVSVLQKTWNGGDVISASDWTSDVGGSAADQWDTIIDDWASTGSFNYARWAGLYTDAADPAPIDIRMNAAYNIGVVAITTIADNRAPRAVDVYASPDDDPANFVLIIDNWQLPLTSGSDVHNYYHETQFAAPFASKMLRFDFERGHGNGRTYVSEVFAFIPEPTGLLPLLAGALVLRRRR